MGSEEECQEELSPRCPLDPVSGIVKLIIWAAKMKVPRTPMSGTYSFTVRVADAASSSATRILTVTVTAPISLTITSAGVTFPTLKPAKYSSCANCHTSIPYTTPLAGQRTP